MAHDVEGAAAGAGDGDAAADPKENGAGAGAGAGDVAAAANENGAGDDVVGAADGDGAALRPAVGAVS